MEANNDPVVLVVDDESDLADLFAAWLGTEYVVETAYSGEGALEALDEHVDVVLLDRCLPDLSGDEVLSTARERDLDCRVAMVTALDSEFDTLEMGFDTYLTKPVTKVELQDAVETLLARKQNDAAVQRYYQLVSKRATLEAEFGSELSTDPRYRALQADIEALEAELEERVTDFGDEDFEAQLHRLE